MQNNDLISREKLQKAFERECIGECGCCKHIKHNPEGCALIDNAPAVDAEPVRRGSWGECRITGYDGLHAVYTRPCSECGHEARFSTNYCPICGAKMDKEE